MKDAAYEKLIKVYKEIDPNARNNTTEGLGRY
jgi:hypothetical protein